MKTVKFKVVPMQVPHLSMNRSDGFFYYSAFQVTRDDSLVQNGFLIKIWASLVFEQHLDGEDLIVKEIEKHLPSEYRAELVVNGEMKLIEIKEKG